MPSGFGGRSEYELSMGHVSLQGVLAAAALVGGRAGVAGARARVRCKQGLLLCSVAVTTLSGMGEGPKEPEGVGFLLGVMAVSVFVGAWESSLMLHLPCMVPLFMKYTINTC